MSLFQRSPLTFHEALEPLRAARVAQLAQRLGLDLADALARDRELLPHFFKRVVRLLSYAETHSQHLLLARGEGRQHLLGLLLEVDIDHGVRRRDDAIVLDEIA